MSDALTLPAEMRERAGKGASRALRREGRVPAVIYGAGPRTVFESNAKRADEHLVLDDLRKATKVVARTLLDLMR